MGRHALISRGHLRFWLARKIAARQPLVVRLARHQRLAQAFGLAGTAAEAPGRVIVLRGQGFNQAQQVALPPVNLVFRPPFVQQAKSGYEESSVTNEPLEVQDQQVASMNQPLEVQDQELVSADQQPELLEIQYRDHLQEQPIAERTESSTFEPGTPPVQRVEAHQPPEINEPVEAQSQQGQESADSSAQPLETVKAKRPRGRIQEQPGETVQVQPSLIPPRKAHGNDQEKTVPKQADFPMRETDHPVKSADNLFAPRDIDRSPQAWMARLMGAKSATHENMASLGLRPTTGQEDTQMQAGESEQLESEPQATASGQFTRNYGFAAPIEKSAVVESQANRNRRLKSSDRPSVSMGVKMASNDLRPQATPLSQRTRRFLQPLVGIDPASVRVHRDAVAERLTGDYQADAITIGDDVEMAAGLQDDTPETMGLLAHEFTHVARLREPHFIPPIARSMHSRLPTSSQASLADEEALALQVEGRAKWMAQEQIDQTAPYSIGFAGNPFESSVGATGFVPGTTSAPDTWGGLPAPWEPLPDWLVSLPEIAEGSGPVAGNSSQPSPVAYKPGLTEMTSDTFAGADIGSGSIPGNAGVQRAASERSSSMEEIQTPTSTSLPSPDTAKTPEPDLDALARQVYSLLKRRLGVEYRRES